MKAIILTAGSGKRMRPLTDSTHKTLLEVKGRTVIQWILDALLENGVTDIAIVTGYQAAELKAYLDRTYPGLPIVYVHNERYAQTNNIYSMALALESLAIESDVVLIECDLIFEPAVLKRLLDSRHPNVALVDRYRRGMDGTVVQVSDGIISEVITPEKQNANFSYEDKFKTLNIYRFSKEFCSGTFKKLLTYYAKVINENAYYELVIGIIIYLQHETVYAEVLIGEKWAELDDPNDVNIARFHFDPAIRQEVLDKSFGGLWNYDLLDFCYIRNMYFPTGAILSEIKNNLPSLIQNYGSAQSILDEKLAYYLLCRPKHLLALNGASQAFPWLRTFFAAKRPLIPAPTFGEYARIFPQAACYPDDVGLDMEKIARQARQHDLLVLVNPNNPTGSTLDTAWIYNYAAGNLEKTVIVDESFVEFSGQKSLLPMLEAEPLPNVILVKSLSKALGAPGLRLGYVYTAHPGFGAFARAQVPIWNLNSLAEQFLEIILKHRPVIQASFAHTILDRERFAADLKALPIVRQVHQSGGNFLLVSLRCPRESSGTLAGELLRRHNIHIKDVSDRFRSSGASFRLAVRLPQENAQLVRCLAQLDTTPAPATSASDNRSPELAP